MDEGKKKILVATTAFVAVILLIALFDHYPVRIIDALTLQPVDDYGVHIPVGRILFEPVMGLLLFFNRSLYALTEVPYALGWMFLLYLLWAVVKGFSFRERRERMQWWGGRLVDLPIVGGILLGLFVVMIFLRLPGNTIVNHTQDEVLVTTHCHTEWSHDGLIPQKALWRWMRRNGFDAFFITDHNNHNKTLEFVQAQRQGAFPQNPLVMCGEEFSGSNHLSLLGLQFPFSTKGFSDTLAVDTTHAQGGAVIVNHWFDGEHMTLPYYRNLGVDGFEIENTATDRYYSRDIYRKIKTFCEKNGLIMNGGLDFHGYGNVCSLWNAFTIPGWHKMGLRHKERAILEVLRERDQSRLRVLMYHDRPYYGKKNLWYRPWFTLFSYFRTLNGWQVLSWVFWVIIFVVVFVRYENRSEASQRRMTGLVTAAKGMVAALFLLAMALRFHLLAPHTAGYNDIYPEYAKLFFTIALPYLVYVLVVTAVRWRRRRRRRRRRTVRVK